MPHAQPREALRRPERAPATGRDRGLDSIEQAIADIAVGKPVVVVDDEDRENEGDLIFAAELATPELLAFMVRHTSGLVCVALSGEDCDRLDLPPMREVNQDKRGTAYRVSVDAAHGVSTGISATDRARTIRLLAQASAGPGDFTRPGHVLPLRAREGGVLSRTGHTEAAADLARLAGLRPAGALCELVSQQDVTGMARLGECRSFAAEHHLAIISIADLVAYRLRVASTVVRAAETSIPTEHGEFPAVGYHSLPESLEHVALVRGEIGAGEGVLVRSTPSA